MTHPREPVEGTCSIIDSMRADTQEIRMLTSNKRILTLLNNLNSKGEIIRKRAYKLRAWGKKEAAKVDELQS